MSAHERCWDAAIFTTTRATHRILETRSILWRAAPTPCLATTGCPRTNDNGHLIFTITVRRADGGRRRGSSTSFACTAASSVEAFAAFGRRLSGHCLLSVLTGSSWYGDHDGVLRRLGVLIVAAVTVFGLLLTSSLDTCAIGFRCSGVLTPRRR